MGRINKKCKATNAKETASSFQVNDRNSQETNVGDVVFVAVTSFAENCMDNAVAAVAQLCNGVTRPFPLFIFKLNEGCIPNIDPTYLSFLDCALNEDWSSNPVFPARNYIHVFDARTLG